MEDKVMQAAKTLVEIVQPMVEVIEASPAVTMDRYDQYMGVLCGLAKAMGTDRPGVYKLMAAALVKAGANKRGVASALMVLGKE